MAFADAHDGVASSLQLRERGMSYAGITRRADRGFLVPIENEVYAVGRQTITRRGHMRAALLAVGDDAALCRYASAELLGLIKPSTDRPIEVLTTRSGLADGRHYTVRETRALPSRDVWRVGGMRTTAPSRTIRELASVEGETALMSLCSEAAARGWYDRAALLDTLGRGRPGSARLRRVLATLDVGGGHTRQEFEHAFRRLIQRHGIRAPQFNHKLWTPSGKLIIPDAAWMDIGFVVELDSRAFHDNDPAFLTDREKDLLYEELGLDCLRLLWRHVVGEEARVARVLARRVGTI